MVDHCQWRVSGVSRGARQALGGGTTGPMWRYIPSEPASKLGQITKSISWMEYILPGTFDRQEPFFSACRFLFLCFYVVLQHRRHSHHQVGRLATVRKLPDRVRAPHLVSALAQRSNVHHIIQTAVSAGRLLRVSISSKSSFNTLEVAFAGLVLS